MAKDHLSSREKRLVQQQLADIMQDYNGLKIYQEASKKYLCSGLAFSAENIGSKWNGGSWNLGYELSWRTLLVGRSRQTPYFLQQEWVWLLNGLTPDIFLTNRTPAINRLRFHTNRVGVFLLALSVLILIQCGRMFWLQVHQAKESR